MSNHNRYNSAESETGEGGDLFRRNTSPTVRYTHPNTTPIYHTNIDDSSSSYPSSYTAGDDTLNGNGPSSLTKIKSTSTSASASAGQGNFATGFFQTISNTFKLNTSSSNSSEDDSVSIQETLRTIMNQKASAKDRTKAMSLILTRFDSCSDNMGNFNDSLTNLIPSQIWTMAKLQTLLDSSKHSDSLRGMTLAFLELLCYLNEYDGFLIDINMNHEGGIGLDTKEMRSVGYLTDLIHSCYQGKKKGQDNQFKVVLRIVKRLTNDGTFVFLQNYLSEVVGLTRLFIASSLRLKSFGDDSETEIELLKFVQSCVRSGVFGTDHSNSSGSEKLETEDELMKLMFETSLKTGDKLILRECILVMNEIILQHQSHMSQSKCLSSEQCFTMLEILTNSMVLDMEFYELGAECVMNVIQTHTKTWEEVYELLVRIVGCDGTENKNINASIGAMKFLISALNDGTISLQNIDLMKLVQTLNVISQWEKLGMNCMVLQLLERVILRKLGYIQSFTVEKEDDKNEVEVCHLILQILRNVSVNIANNEKKKKNDKTLLELTHFFRQIINVSIQNLLDTAAYPGDISELIHTLLLSKDVQAVLNVKNCIYVIRWFVNEGKLTPGDSESPNNKEWRDTLTYVMSLFFFQEANRDISVRKAMIRTAFDLIRTLSGTEDSQFVSDLLFKTLLNGNDSTEIITITSQLLMDLCLESPQVSSSLLKRYVEDKLAEFPIRNLIIVTKCLISNFMVQFLKCDLNTTASATEESSTYTYNLLITITNHTLATYSASPSTSQSTDLLLLTSRLLVRLRSSFDNQVYITAPSDIEGLSAAFGRNVKMEKTESKHENDKMELDQKWWYPEDVEEIIPKAAINRPSPFLKYIGNGNDRGIDITSWFQIVIKIISTGTNWEIYSFIYCYFCPQLSNVSLFTSNPNCGDLMRQFTSILTDQLRLNLPSSLSGSNTKNIPKTDLQIAIIRTITPLLSYVQAYIPKPQQDQLLNLIITTTLPTTTSISLETSLKLLIPTMHLLTIILHVAPLTLKKHIPLVLTRLQTKVSSGTFVNMIAPHLLEWLITLNGKQQGMGLTLVERKCVVGLCVRCIQFARDWFVWRRRKNSNGTTQGGAQGAPQGRLLQHGALPEVDFKPSTGKEDSESQGNADIIPNYILTLSYDVMTSWFLSVSLEDRPELAKFVITNLINSDSGGVISDLNLGFVDLIERFTYADLKIGSGGGGVPCKDPKFETEGVSSGNWVLGESVVTISTLKKTGESMVVVRRASGISQYWISSKPPVADEEVEDEEEDDDSAEYTAQHILLQLLSHKSPIPSPSQSNTHQKPLLIPPIPQLTRSLTTLDHIPTIQTHKIGLLYIGPTQNHESDILRNTTASIDSEEYSEFLDGLGGKIKLKKSKGKTQYTAGLDTTNDADGEHALVWKDKVMQLVWHVTSMMPNSKTISETASEVQKAEAEVENGMLKKRHVGNDYVNVFFDESGIDLDQSNEDNENDDDSAFDFNVIKSQFNFINVVIQPHSVTFHSKNKDMDTDKTQTSTTPAATGGSSKEKLYKVKTYRRKGIPPIFSTTHFKIIPLSSIPIMIKQLSLLCDQFANVWHHNYQLSSSASSFSDNSDGSEGDKALYQSNWAHRARQICTIRERVEKHYENEELKKKKEEELDPNSSNGNANNGAGGGTGSTVGGGRMRGNSMRSFSKE
ncbi:hypothetical protein WICPIJ_008894 [Wickerhamomyces pijperi]|uniref:Rap-GAP domain-containing protein n=1 Tax=Wickerhamomyces pijperi TaxID=599730 RepID=A0A9P8TGS6_WICPI|nr:hypothetical protein WICPIJ_008894 [Wickerhamomyces pijperi]